jgi:carboxylesterase type B
MKSWTAAAVAAVCVALLPSDARPVKTTSGLVSGAAGRNTAITWANFAASGDPNGRGLPDWPAVSKDAALTMEVGEEFRAMPIAATQPRVEFFRRFLSRPAGRL